MCCLGPKATGHLINISEDHQTLSTAHYVPRLAFIPSTKPSSAQMQKKLYRKSNWEMYILTLKLVLMYRTQI